MEDLAAIKETLNYKFDALKAASGFNDKANSFRVNYIGFIGQSPVLSKILKALIDEGKIGAERFRILFYDCMTSNAVQAFAHEYAGKGKSTPKLPLFWDKDLEKRYGLMAGWLKMIQDADVEYQEAKKKGKSKELFKGENITYDATSDVIDAYDLHAHIMEKLTEMILASVSQKQTASFDPATAVLSINGKNVKFRRFTEQYHTLRILFANKDRLKDDWFYSEIGEAMDRGKRYTDKDFHNYFSAIGRHVAAKAGIDDLFLTTGQSVRINGKYL